MGDVLVFEKLKFENVRGKKCEHHHIQYNLSDRTTICADCNSPIDAFTAYQRLIVYWERIERDLKYRKEHLSELEERVGKHILKATKRVDEAWRSKNMVPVCPHCKNAIFPEDGFGGDEVDKKMEIEKRRFIK
jgi:hypothetical protein